MTLGIGKLNVQKITQTSVRNIISTGGFSRYSYNTGQNFANINQGTTRFVPVSNNNIEIAEADAQIQTDVDEFIEAVTGLVIANSLDGECVVRLRDDGATVAGAELSIGAGLTGIFVDLVPLTQISTGSLICLQVDCTAGTAGAITFQNIGVTTRRRLLAP